MTKPTYSELLEQSTQLAENDANEMKKKATFVKKSLFFISDTFAKIVSNIIGFERLLESYNKSRLPHSYLISLPTMIYSSFSRDEDEEGNLIDDSVRLQTISTVDASSWLIRGASFRKDFIRYRINRLASFRTLLMVYHYMVDSLSKIMGWAFISFFTIPTYFAIGTFYGIKRILLERKIEATLEQFPPQEFEKEWVKKNNYIKRRSDTTYEGRLPFYTDLSKLFPASIEDHIDQLRKYTSLEQHVDSKSDEFPGLYTAILLLPDCTIERKKWLDKKRKWSFFKMFITLGFSISAHKKLNALHEAEKARNHKNVMFAYSILDLDRSRRSSQIFNERDPALEIVYYCYRIGKILLQTTEANLAFSYFLLILQIKNDTLYSARVCDEAQKYATTLVNDNRYDLVTGYFQQVLETLLNDGKENNFHQFLQWAGHKEFDLRHFDEALNYLTRVSPNSEHYKDAMDTCGHIWMGKGKYNLAIPFFEKSGNTQALNVVRRLSQDNNAPVEGISRPLPTESKIIDLTSSGVTINNPALVDVRGLDEDDDPLPVEQELKASLSVSVAPSSDTLQALRHHSSTTQLLRIVGDNQPATSTPGTHSSSTENLTELPSPTACSSNLYGKQGTPHSSPSNSFDHEPSLRQRR